MIAKQRFIRAAGLAALTLAACVTPREPVGTPDAASDTGSDTAARSDTAAGSDTLPATPDGPPAPLADAPVDAGVDTADAAPDAPAACTPQSCAPYQACVATRCSPRYEATVVTLSTGGSVWDLAVASDGSMYLAGIYKGTVDFDPGPAEDQRSALAAGDVFVSRYTAGGTYQWTRTIPASGDEGWVHAVATADVGVAISGHFRGTADFFPGRAGASRTSSTADEGYVLKLDAAGGFSFLRTFPGAYSSTWDVESLKDGSLLAVGPFTGPVDLGNGSQSGAMMGGYAVRMSPTGSPTWVRTFVGGIPGIAREATDGAVTLAGSFTGKLDLDPGAGASEVMVTPGQGLFSVKLDAGGAFVNGAGVPFGGAREVIPREIAHGNDGSRYVVGEFIEGAFPPATTGSSPRPNAGDRDIFIAKLSATGTFAWGHAYGGPAGDYAWSATDAEDGALVTGLFASDAVDFGAPGTPDRREATAGNLFVLRLTPAGATRVLFTLGPRNMVTPALIRTTTGGFVLGGVFSGPVDFNPHPTDRDERASTGRSGFVSRYAF